VDRRDLFPGIGTLFLAHYDDVYDTIRPVSFPIVDWMSSKTVEQVGVFSR
jgi:hypothetical protein